MTSSNKLKTTLITITNDDSTIKWADIDDKDETTTSITSEEDLATDYDSEQRTRCRPVEEIWSDQEISHDLQSLPDADEIHNLLKNDNLELLLEKNHESGVLLASWTGKYSALKKLLDLKTSVFTTDNHGRTAVHLAAYSGHLDCLKLLIDRGARVTVWDTKHFATPLHCAANLSRLACLRLLIKHGADPNAGIDQKSPLYYAVQSVDVECVRELLENNASPNTPQIFTETPLHLAATLGTSDIMRLLLNAGAAPNVQYGHDKLTPLHLAAEDGDADCVQLLIEKGANVELRNHKNQTALHLAALAQSPETLELLLTKGADPNAADIDGRTPLHCAIVKVSRSSECVQLLLKAGVNVNQSDAFGYTPMHLAALNEFSHSLMMLLNHGGDVTARTKGGISVLTFITRKIPDVIPKYVAKFDNSIKLNDHDIGDVDCELKLDFRVLIPTRGNRETELLLNFIEVGHKEILKHPLCETFLFLKWRRIRKFFLFSLFYHLLFVFLYTFYIIGMYLPSAKNMVRVCEIGFFLLFFNLLMLAKELFQMGHSWAAYFRQWENWLQWLIIISVFCCVKLSFSTCSIPDDYSWHHIVAAIGIFLAWVELMMIVGRFPTFGLYIQMFTTVSINFTKFFLAYFCLLIAFTLNFAVVFANCKTWNLKWIVIKVIIMMSGELDYEDVILDESYPLIYQYTAQIMYLLFVMLVTVILTNLMVGLAVSDIQGLQQSAGLDRLVRQAELVARLESMLFSRLLTCLPVKLMKFLHKQASLLNSDFHWALYIKPNDPREERIPKDLIKSIFQVVADRKERPKSKKMRRSFKSALSQTISRANSIQGGLVSDSMGRDVYIHKQLEEISKEFQENAKTIRQKLDVLNNYVINSQRM